jgi:hypothetical protein
VSIRIDADADGGDKADDAAAAAAVAEAEAEAEAGDWWYEIGGSRAASEGNVAVPNGVDDAGDEPVAVAGRKLRDDMSEADSEDRSEDEDEDEPLAIVGFGIESAVRMDDDDADAGGRCGEAQRTGDSW